MATIPPGFALLDTGLREAPGRANTGLHDAIDGIDLNSSTNPATAAGADAPWWRWLGVSVAVIVADYVTKAAIVAALRPGEQLPVTGFFSLVLAFNTGAAFSFLAAADGWQRWLFAVIAVAASAVIVWLLRRGGSVWYCLGLALILGGALGNLWDRLAIGKVVDFLLFHYAGWAYPAFNVADSAITIGAALVILDGFRHKRTQPGVNDA